MIKTNNTSIIDVKLSAGISSGWVFRCMRHLRKGVRTLDCGLGRFPLLGNGDILKFDQTKEQKHANQQHKL